MDLEFILIFTLFTLVCIFPICRYFIDWVPACLGRQWAMYKVSSLHSPALPRS